MANLPSVFVAQDSGVDLTPACAFGYVRRLIDQPFSPLENDYQPLVAIIERRLADVTEQDWLIPIGDPVVIGIAATVMARNLDGRLRLLRWDRRLKIYHPITTYVDVRTRA